MTTLTDLHTHILPGLDDGAADLETAVQMLCAQKQQGVCRVALTSHFYPLREELEAYLERRRQAYELLLSAWEADTMPQLQLGAEVRYSPSLAELDLRQLTLGESDYLLLELSDMRFPAYIKEIVELMHTEGITPILAHVERCEYFRKEPEYLSDLIRMGALAQVSVKALKDRKVCKFAKACLENGLAQIIASDAHNMKNRGPCLRDVEEIMEAELVERAEDFALAVWENRPVPNFLIGTIKKRGWSFTKRKAAPASKDPVRSG